MEKERNDSLFDPYFWKKIVKVFLVNVFTVPLVIIALFILGLINEPPAEMVEKFRQNYDVFFKPLNQFFDFFFEYALRPAILEELVYRGPIRILAGFLLFFRKESNPRIVTIVWIVGLGLNFHWSFYVHSLYGIFWTSVFTAGLAWLWLVIRTNRLWPAIFCHAAANLSIYFLIKIYQLF